MYICTLSGMFEEMMERGKEIQSVQQIIIHIILNSSLFLSICETLQIQVEQMDVCTNEVY